MNPLSGIYTALMVEYQKRDPSIQAMKSTTEPVKVANNAASSSAISETSKLGANFNSSKKNAEPKIKRTVQQVQDGVKEVVTFLSTPEGKIINELFA